MKRSSELLKNTAIISLGKISTQIISFLLLPLYTARLATEELGYYDFVITVASFGIPIITLLMEESMFRFLIDAKNDSEKKEIISNTFFICIGNAIIVTFISYILIVSFDYKLGYFILMYAVASLFVSLSNALARGVGNIQLFSISNFASSALIIVLNLVLILVFHLGFEALVYSAIVSHILISLFVFAKLKIHRYLKVTSLSLPRIKQMLKYSVPLVPNSISWAVINMSDRLLIISYLGASFNGLYTVSYKFPNIINNFYSYFNIAWRETSARILNDDDLEEIRKVYKKTTFLLFSVSVGLIAIVPFIYSFFVNHAYAESIKYVPILAISVFYTSLSGFYGGIFTAFKDTKILGYTSVFAAVINLTVDFLLIKHIGLYAAAISTLVSSIFLYMYRMIAARKYIKLYNRIDLLFALVFLSSYLVFCSDILIIKIVFLLFAVLLAIYLNKSILTKLLTSIYYRIKKT